MSLSTFAPAGPSLFSLYSPASPSSSPAAPSACPVDPCQGKSRSAESRDAHARALPFKAQRYQDILAVVRGRGDTGATVKELAEALGTQPHVISGRLSELKAAGSLRPKTDTDGKTVRRDGAAVLVLSN